MGSLTLFWLIIALALNPILGLWPVVLQRYYRLRLHRAIYAHSRLLHRSVHISERQVPHVGRAAGAGKWKDGGPSSLWRKGTLPTRTATVQS